MAAGLNIQDAIDSAADNAIQTMQVKNLLAERYEQFNTKQRQTQKAIKQNARRVEYKYKNEPDEQINAKDKKARLSQIEPTKEKALEKTQTPQVKSIKDYVNQKQRLINTENTIDAINKDMMVEKSDEGDVDARYDLFLNDTQNHLGSHFGEKIRQYLNPDFANGTIANDAEQYEMKKAAKAQRDSAKAQREAADRKAQEEAADKIKRKSQAKVKIPAGNPTERGMNFD
jgi:hypothetical protein